MIRNNLAALLAENGIKITRLAADTGLSRNTITSTAQNDGKMIQLETINLICQRLQISPTDFFEYLPFDLVPVIEFSSWDGTPKDIWLGNKLVKEVTINTFNLDVFVKRTSKDKSSDITFEFSAVLEKPWKDIENHVPYYGEPISINIDINKESLSDFGELWYHTLSAGFREQFKQRIVIAVVKAAREYLKHLDGFVISPFSVDEIDIDVHCLFEKTLADAQVSL